MDLCSTEFRDNLLMTKAATRVTACSFGGQSGKIGTSIQLAKMRDIIALAIGNTINKKAQTNINCTTGPKAFPTKDTKKLVMLMNMIVTSYYCEG